MNNVRSNKRRNLLTVAAITGIVALGGVAATANAAGNPDVRDQSIQSVDIATNGVGSSEIRPGAVGTSEVRDQSLQSVDLGSQSVGASEIRNNTITLADINDSTEKSLKGQKGDTGPQGPAGADGEDGKDGTNGKDGTSATPEQVTGAVNEYLAENPVKGEKGDTGEQGVPGANGLDGAVYRTMTYENGGGGSATVACHDDNVTSQDYVAISGGVQGSTVTSQNPDGFAVSSSFPGRMDWNTNEPKENRLDGWIVLGNGNYTDTLTVWALCVPAAGDIDVQHGFLDN